MTNVNNIITRPVVVGGTLYAGVQCDDSGTPGVIWGDAATGSLTSTGRRTRMSMP